MWVKVNKGFTRKNHFVYRRSCQPRSRNCTTRTSQQGHERTTFTKHTHTSLTINKNPVEQILLNSPFKPLQLLNVIIWNDFPRTQIPRSIYRQVCSSFSNRLLLRQSNNAAFYNTFIRLNWMFTNCNYRI